MKANVGNLDRALRVIVGLALIGAAALGWIGTWGWIGVIPLVTGMVRVCPAYSVFGIRTCRAPEPKT